METLLYILLLIMTMVAVYFILGAAYLRFRYGSLYPTFESALIEMAEEIVENYEYIFKDQGDCD